ncbi:MAG: hypothetical protein H8M99_10830 [Gloeobacteraceae cyanobacterium ES-bin-144]|nr:hypothetical protein [Verrucomicrobiales bacterium]
MSEELTTDRVLGNRRKNDSRFLKSVKMIGSSFIKGPKVLLTRQLSFKCAVIMMMSSLPSLLCCFLLTVPAILFQSPEQNAYFYFSQILSEDPTSWLILLLTGVCSVLSLGIPASDAGPSFY